MGMILCWLIGSCESPVHITANPDDQTSSSGTAGSAKMTTQLPPKPDNMKLPDSLKLPDTAKVKRDTE